MRDLNLTKQQFETLSTGLKNLEPNQEGEFYTKIKVFNYVDLLCKILAMIKACKELTYDIGNTEKSKVDFNMIWHIYYLLETAEQMSQLFEEMEVLDDIRQETSR